MRANAVDRTVILSMKVILDPLAEGGLGWRAV
jgi:hypothetical protein